MNLIHRDRKSKKQRKKKLLKTQRHFFHYIHKQLYPCKKDEDCAKQIVYPKRALFSIKRKMPKEDNKK